MFQSELIRIFSRKITLLAMLIPVLILVCFYNFSAYWGETVIDNGAIYYKGAAISKNKEIAEEFAGTLTEETVRGIWEKYGPPINYFNRNTTGDNMTRIAKSGGNDNYCNLFVARLFCDKMTDENGNAILVLQDNISDSPYLQGDFTFGYVGNGWTSFWDHFLMSWVMACLVILVALCPTFSEDYAFRTADILLPAQRGRFHLWKTRMGAGCFFASIYYWLLGLALFVELWMFYGLDGLQASAGLFGYQLQADPAGPLWKTVAFIYLSNWFSLLMLTALVMAVSALCKKSFASLIWSLGLYFGPFAIMRIVLDQLPVNRIMMWIRMVIYSLPFSYGGCCLNAPTVTLLVMTGVEVAAGGIGVVFSVRGWCRHQVEG